MGNVLWSFEYFLFYALILF